MCGITGYLVNKPISKNILVSMNEVMINRGPDSSGYYYDREFAGAMRRLSINDVENGDQPLFNQSKSVVLFYNGEIYNYNFLRNLLEAKGYQFNTRSDGEVICHLYDEYKTELFSMLDGMFAIAIWDTNERRLILARDTAGEKPLYYYLSESNELVFGSTLKSICKFPGIDVSLDFSGIWDIPTFTWIPQPQTIFKKIKSLPKSHYVIFDCNRAVFKKFNYKYKNDYSGLNDKELIQITKETVESSVNLRLLSDVPIGSFLSGGLDSSIVSYIASKKINKLKTYTIGFENTSDLQHGKADESSQAVQFAKFINSDHRTIRVKSSDFLRNLQDYIAFADQPMGIPSGLGIMAIAKYANKDGIKVLLSGDCADECFGGYSWYPYINQIVENKINNENDSEIFFHNYEYSNEERASIIQNYNSHKQAWAWHYYASESQKKNIFSKDIISESHSSLRHFQKFNSNTKWSGKTFISQDRDFYLSNEMLQKLDRMTMAASVEGRVPFASPSVINLAEQLEFSHFYRNKTLKWILKQAFKDDLPKEIINRPKHGFNVPLDDWFRNDWSYLIDECFSSDSCLYNENIIKKDCINYIKLLASDKNTLNSPIIFSLIVLELWLKERLKWK